MATSPPSPSAALPSHPQGAHSSQALPRSAFPLPPRGPWACELGPPISCAAPAPPASTRGGKFLSFRGAAPSPSFQAARKARVRGKEAGLQASGQRGEVSCPQTHNRGARLGQLGKLPGASGGGAPRRRRRRRLFSLGSGATCRRSTGRTCRKAALPAPEPRVGRLGRREDLLIYAPRRLARNVKILRRLGPPAAGGARPGPGALVEGSGTRGAEVGCP